MPDFAVHLKSARLKAGYDSAADCARELGVSVHTYRNWERGTAEPRDIGTVMRICKLLKISPNDLLPVPNGSVAP